MNSEIRVGQDQHQGWFAQFQGDIRDELIGLLDTDILPVPMRPDASADEVISHLARSYPDSRITVNKDWAQDMGQTCFDTLLFSLRRYGMAPQLQFWTWVSVTVTVLSIQNGADSDTCLDELALILAEPGVINRPQTNNRLSKPEIADFTQQLRRLLGLVA